MNDCSTPILGIILVALIGIWVTILIKMLCRKGEDEDD